MLHKVFCLDIVEGGRMTESKPKLRFYRDSLHLIIEGSKELIYRHRLVSDSRASRNNLLKIYQLRRQSIQGFRPQIFAVHPCYSCQCEINKFLTSVRKLFAKVSDSLRYILSFQRSNYHSMSRTLVKNGSSTSL